MRRRNVLLATGAVASTALAGCLGSADEETDPGDDSDSERTITVSESGEVSAEPDMAVLQVGVEATGDDPGAVRDELAERGDALYDALVEYGIDEDDITTSRFRIRERVDRERMRAEGVEPSSEEDLEPYTIYLGTHSYRVEVQTVENAGEVVDTAVDAGADTVDRIRFTLSEEKREALRQDALETALADADSEAEFVAGQVDATIVEAKHVDTSGGRVSPVREEFDMADGAAAPPETSFEPGDVTVSATVEVRYTME